ncbi:MAG: hypothetical protein HZB56_15345 [Deltaproteobacteria bacterium]|nr:hypothetical protein [Deltaproteobacteria bacterium]
MVKMLRGGGLWPLVAACVAAVSLGCGGSKKTTTTGTTQGQSSTTVSGSVYVAGSVSYAAGVLAGGTAISAASVKVNGTKLGETNEQGYFSVTGVPAGDRVSVCIEAANHVTGCRNVRVVAGRGLLLGPTELRAFADIPNFAEASITGAGTVSDASGNARADLPTGTICRADRTTVVTTAFTCAIAPLDPAVAGQARYAPGSFEGRTSGGQQVSLVSGGMMDIVCTLDATGEKVNVCTGKTASVRIPINTSCSDTARYPATMQSWGFDEATGLWVEEASFTKTCDGGGVTGYYAGTASHFSYWNADQVANTACVTGTILGGDAVPVSGARIYCEGSDYSGASEAYTGDDGKYCVQLKTGGTASCVATKGSFQAAAFSVTAGATAMACGNAACQAVANVTLSDPLIRSALTWGATPSDLDSHWVSAGGGAPETHVYFSSRGSLAAAPYAALDTDDTSSFGPEVVTVMPSVPAGVYRYCIHDYSNGGSTTSTVLQGSTAKVELVLRGGARAYQVPQGAGTVWQVFELTIDANRNVTVRDLNRVVATAGAATDALTLCRAN